jgi:hypothetical protein
MAATAIRGEAVEPTTPDERLPRLVKVADLARDADVHQDTIFV